MPNFKDEAVTQALAHVAKLGGYTLKKVATADDLQNRTLTITFIGISGGFVQETLPYEREDLTYGVDGKNGHVDSIEGVQPGDLAETEAQANEEIAAAAVADGTSAPDPDEAGTADEATARDMHPGVEEKPDIHLVGEAAALGKKRR